jgi:hypothetical protein
MNTWEYARFEFGTAVLLKTEFFWDVMLCFFGQ